jgi:hypothetical protein
VTPSPSPSATPSPYAGNKIVYIASTGTFGAGTSASVPLDASTAAKYDTIVQQTYRSNTTFYYAAGVYLTNGYNGNSADSNMNPNCQHIGAGMNQTILRLSPSTTLPSGAVALAMISDNGYSGASGYQLWNMTVDGNAMNNSQFLNGVTSITLLNGIGSNIDINGDKFMGFGISNAAIENFAVFFQPNNNYPGQTFSNLIVENSIFTSPATGNQGGSTVLTIMPTTSTYGVNMTARNNQFINVASDFAYSHAASVMNFVGNTVNGAGEGWYTEPGSWGSTLADNDGTYAVSITGNTFTNVVTALDVNIHSNGAFGSVTFSNNVVTNLLPVPGPSTPGSAVNFSQIDNTTACQFQPAVASLTMSGNSIEGTAFASMWNAFNSACKVGTLTFTNNCSTGLITVPSGLANTETNTGNETGVASCPGI